MGTIKADVTVQMGFVPLQVNVKSIIEGEKSTAMSNVCVGTADSPHDPVRIKQVNRCPLPDCANEDKGTHTKAKVVNKSELVLVPQEEQDKIAEEAKKYTNAMPITVHPAEDVKARTLETGTAYYLEPATPAFAEIYAMVVHEIKKHPESALVTMWAVRSAPAMYRFDVRDDVLVIRQLAWPHQVQAAPSVPTTFNPMYEAQADMFIESTKADFDPDTYRDVRGDILSSYVASQVPIPTQVVEGKAVTAPAALDVMALLEASIPKGAAKKAAAKKTTKKAAAKAS